MQAYANVGTPPERHVAKSGKVYWEFRASESSRGEDKNPTWYTCRVFKDEDPKLVKGDFVCFTGKLKQDVFMGRDGKPMGVLTVMAFSLQKVAKDGKREVVVNEPQSASTAAQAIADSAKGGTKRQTSPTVAAPTPPVSSASAPQPGNPASTAPQVKEESEALAFPEIDESYLRLVA
jgi:single-stranded DNA-binding protein